jgi:hypothetical protein
MRHREYRVGYTGTYRRIVAEGQGERHAPRYSGPRHSRDSEVAHCANVTRMAYSSPPDWASILLALHDAKQCDLEMSLHEWLRAHGLPLIDEEYWKEEHSQ